MIRPLVICALGLGCAGCWSDRHYEYRYYYPSGLEQAATQIYAWPAGEGDCFRFAAQSEDLDLAGTWGAADALSLSADSARITELLASSLSLTVLLGPGATPQQRSAAFTLVERAGEARPELSVHVLALEHDLDQVQSGAQLQFELDREAAFRAAQRPAGGWQVTFGALERVLELQARPNLVVVPLDSPAGGFAICGNFRDESQALELAECSQNELKGAVAARRASSYRNDVLSAWGAYNGGERFSISMPAFGGTSLLVCLPQDMPGDARARCEELARSLCAPDLAPIAVALADVDWKWGECTSAQAVLQRLGQRAVAKCIVGHVREFGIHSEPSATER